VYKPKFKSKRAMIFTVLGSLVIAGGISFGADAAFASIPDSGGVIHGCYKANASGKRASLGVIDTALSGGVCPSGQTEVDWNQTGPTGPAGATGATGPAGPSTAGPDGLGVTVEVGAEASGGVATAECPSAEPFVVGGGGTDGPGEPIDYSVPWDFTTSDTINNAAENTTDQYGWRIIADQESYPVYAFAICSA